MSEAARGKGGAGQPRSPEKSPPKESPEKESPGEESPWEESLKEESPLRESLLKSDLLRSFPLRPFHFGGGVLPCLIPRTLSTQGFPSLGIFASGPGGQQAQARRAIRS